MEPFWHRTDVQPRFRDTDAMGHVNNAVYLTYLEVARQAYWEHVAPEVPYDQVPYVMGRATLEFLSPARLGDALEVCQHVAWMSRSSFAIESEIRDKNTARLLLHATCVVVTYSYAERRSIPIPAWLRAAVEKAERRPLPAKPAA